MASMESKPTPANMESGRGPDGSVTNTTPTSSWQRGGQPASGLFSEIEGSVDKEVHFQYMYGSISLLLLLIAGLAFLQHYFRHKLPLRVLPRYVAVGLTPVGGSLPREQASTRHYFQRTIRTQTQITSSAQWAAFHERNMRIFDRHTNAYPNFWQSFAFDPENVVISIAGEDGEDNNENAQLNASTRTQCLSISIPSHVPHHPIPGITPYMNRLIDFYRWRRSQSQSNAMNKPNKTNASPPSYDTVMNELPTYNVAVQLQNQLSDGATVEAELFNGRSDDNNNNNLDKSQHTT